MSDAIPRRMLEAAKVSRFMEAEEQGRWRLRHFTVSDRDYAMGTLKIQFSDKITAQQDLQMTRRVPPGDYITLAREMIWDEVRDIVYDEYDFYPEDAPEWFNLDKVFKKGNRYIPVMSDTPSEIIEHRPAFKGARGRVLITGLGLGCLPHGLLTSDRITRIDIIEIDPDVIALTGKYLTDPRVHIWQGSAADESVVPADLRWDYAWHDIWTHIADRNLDPETAEHRIAYSTLRELWGPRVKRQDCWAEDQAIVMKQVREAEVEKEERWRDYLKSLTLDVRIEVLYHQCLRDRLVGLPGDIEITDEIIQVLDPEGVFREHVVKAVSDPDFFTKAEAKYDNRAREPMGLPNAELEASR